MLSAAALGVLPRRYIGIRLDDELGGGLNNQLMNLAQLLHDACSEQESTALVLPHVTSGWRFFTGRVRSRTPQGRNKRPLPFGELFNTSYFIQRVRPCLAVESLPTGAPYTVAKVVGVNPRWDYHRMLPLIYSALVPAGQLQSVVSELAAAAATAAGRHWAAIHLRIEQDWWLESGFCNVNRYPVRRCIPPAEAAAVTSGHRLRHGTTGAVLLYAANNLAPGNPPISHADFGAQTVKLRIREELPYTIRAAAEFFLASGAPAGFYGNSVSTFSRGVSAAPQRRRAAALAPGCRLAAGVSLPASQRRELAHRASLRPAAGGADAPRARLEHHHQRHQSAAAVPRLFIRLRRVAPYVGAPRVGAGAAPPRNAQQVTLRAETGRQQCTPSRRPPARGCRGSAQAADAAYAARARR